MAAVHQSIAVFRFNQKLEGRRPSVWKVEEGAPIEPVFVVAGSGDILALVRPEKGGLILLRWTTEGTLIARRALDVSGEIAASSLGSDGMLTLVTSTEVMELGIAREEPPVRRQLPDVAKGKNESVAAGSRGAWFEFPDRLVRVGIDGTTTVVKLPIYQRRTAKSQCVPNQQPCEYIEGRDVQATLDGGCLVVEGVMHEYAVSESYQRDRAATYVVSAILPTGQLRVQSGRGEVRSKWQWFWTERRAGANSGFDFGLVRTRYQDGENYVGIHERANGDLLLLTNSPDAIWRLDRSLKKSWKKPVEDPMTGQVVSPSWTRGILVMEGAGSFTAFDDDGDHERKAYFSDVAAQTRPPGVPIKTAVGQASNGDWLIVQY